MKQLVNHEILCDEYRPEIALLQALEVFTVQALVYLKQTLQGQLYRRFWCLE
jgi:hypothetical protein